MTNIINEIQSFKKKCSNKLTLNYFRQPYYKNIYFVTSGILTLTEKQYMSCYYESKKKKYFFIFSQFMQLSTTTKTKIIKGKNKLFKNIGTAYNLKPNCISLKIIEL